MKCKECGVRFDFPVYTIPSLAKWDEANQLGNPVNQRDGSRNTLIPVCPRCYRFTGYKKLLGI